MTDDRFQKEAEIPIELRDVPAAASVKDGRFMHILEGMEELTAAVNRLANAIEMRALSEEGKK